MSVLRIAADAPAGRRRVGSGAGRSRVERGGSARRSGRALRPRRHLRRLAASSPSLTPAPVVAAPRPAPTPRSRKSEMVQISDPYIELRSGPGRGYPIFFVAPRNDWIEIELRHTDWFRIRTEDDKVGWVSRQQLESTLTAAGGTKSFRDVLLDDYLSRKVQLGAAWGHVQVRADVEAVDQLSLHRHLEPRGHDRPGAGRLLGHRHLARRRPDRAVVGPSHLALLRRRRRQVQELPEPEPDRRDRHERQAGRGARSACATT